MAARKKTTPRTRRQASRKPASRKQAVRKPAARKQDSREGESAAILDDRDDLLESIGRGVVSPILHDPKLVTTRNYQITGYPETFLIARDGVIRKKLIGASDWSSEGNRALVRELLGGTTASR